MRRAVELDMTMESGDPHNPDHVPSFEDVAAARTRLVDRAVMDNARGWNGERDDEADIQREAGRAHLRMSGELGDRWRAQVRGGTLSEKKDKSNKASGEKMKSLKAAEKRGVKRRSENVESDEDEEKDEDALGRLDSSLALPVTLSEPGPSDDDDDDDYDPKGKGNAKRVSTRKSTKKTPKDRDNKPTKSEKGQATKKTKLSPWMMPGVPTAHLPSKYPRFYLCARSDAD